MVVGVGMLGVGGGEGIKLIEVEDLCLDIRSPPPNVRLSTV